MTLACATVGRPDAPHEVLLFMGMLATVGTTELRRSALLAAEWDARVTIVDVPGSGHVHSRLTAADRYRLCRGDFASVARRMVLGAQQADPNLRRRRINLVGYSLGASLAAAAAADPGLLQVAIMTFVEPVALEQWNPLRLLRCVQQEDRSASTASEFLEFLGTDELSPARGDLVLLGYALSRGTLGTDLARAGVLHGVGVQIVRGLDSRLCRIDAIERVSGLLRVQGIEVNHLILPGQHSLWHRASVLTTLARSVLERWPDTSRLATIGEHQTCDAAQRGSTSATFSNISDVNDVATATK